MKALTLVVVMALTLSACGVKNDLARPDGTTTPKNTPDPSKPPYPIGR